VSYVDDRNLVEDITIRPASESTATTLVGYTADDVLDDDAVGSVARPVKKQVTIHEPHASDNEVSAVAKEGEAIVYRPRRRSRKRESNSYSKSAPEMRNPKPESPSGKSVRRHSRAQSKKPKKGGQTYHSRW
jgi:hypothetical protein